MGLPRASGFLFVALGVGVETGPGAVFYFLAGAASSAGSGNGPNDPKMIVRGVEVDPVVWELPTETMLRQLAGRFWMRLICFS